MKLSYLATKRVNEFFPELNPFEGSSILYAGLIGIYCRGVECANNIAKSISNNGVDNAIKETKEVFKKACDEFIQVEPDKKVLSLFTKAFEDGKDFYLNSNV